MSISKLRHRITFQTIVTAASDNGFESIEPQVFRTVWAEVSNLHGKEYFQAQAVQAENTVKFTIRYLEGINQDMQILFGGKVYNIESIDHIKYQKRYMEIRALEVT